MGLRKPIALETTFATYQAFDIIGEVGAGRVYKASDEAGAEYAVKLLDPARAGSEKLKRFKNELHFCSRNRHPNILTVVDHGVWRRGKKCVPFYVMPFYASSLRLLIQVGGREGVAGCSNPPYY